MVEEFKKIMLLASVVKTLDGKYKAVLSDDSIDRELEVVGKSFLEGALNDKVFGMLNHSSKVEDRVGDWINKKMEIVRGHNALTAEHKFFLSNPKAVMIKGMLDEGAELGVSIGAIPTKSDKVKINDKEYKRYTEGKILEASFVGIPANENAGAFLTNTYNSNLLIAKELKLDFKEGPTMSDEPTKEELVEKAENIIDTVKDLDADVIEKVLVAARIEKDIYKELLTTLEKEKTAADKAGHPKPPKDPKDKDDPDKDKDKDKDDKKSLTEEQINKMVEAKVTEKMKETPLYKQQMDIMDMTVEEEKDQATEIQKSGRLPIITS